MGTPHTGKNGHHQKNLQAICAGENVKEKGNLLHCSWDINWCSHYGEQYGYPLRS